MRIVAVADTHLFHREQAVPDGDVFVHAGDLCRAGTLDEPADPVPLSAPSILEARRRPARSPAP